MPMHSVLMSDLEYQAYTLGRKSWVEPGLSMGLCDTTPTDQLLEEPRVVTHIVGVEIVVEGRWLRQVCSWCGKILTDYDLANMASSDDKPIKGWPVGVLVDVSGINPVCMSLNTHEEGKLPKTFCGDRETTRSIK